MKTMFGVSVCLALLSPLTVRAQRAPALEYYKLAHGFLPEKKNESGFATGTGFFKPNPWGTYTAYLMATNARGQRTWRIENYVPMGNMTQGSTMYLLEGSRKALLVDTAQQSVSEPGKSDLKTVVRYLLAHRNDGSARPNPVDFVVANTHSHFDHTGENAQMSDRTLYYPDLDWPARAPANYVPIREGGGPTPHGPGTAAGRIDLGERTIEAINLYGHTPGSQGYLDRENNFITTGDAIGSGLVWMHFGPLATYAKTLRHLKAVLAPLNHPAILPAHFYQISMEKRAKPPINGRPLDKAYVDDQLAAAEGILDGTLDGEPYRVVGRNVAQAAVRSAAMTYSLNLLPADQRYHGLRLTGATEGLRSDLTLIRDPVGNTLYLIKGSTRALLIGTGAGAPGLERFVARRVGALPVEVVVTGDGPGQVGGLRAFAGRKVYVPKGASVPRAGLRDVVEVGQGDTISLGTDRAGRPLALRVEPLAGHGLTLLSVADRALFSGDALGAQGADGGLVLRGSLADFDTAFKAWRARTDGQYDTIYTSRNYQWLTLPAFVDQLQSALARGLSGDAAAFATSNALPGYRIVKSAGAPDIVASVAVK